MSQAQLSARQERFEASHLRPASETSLLTLVYRSLAVAPLGQVELQALLQGAQARNRREAITGLIVYDHPHLYQWLEGPQESVFRVMETIQSDTRHTDIQILSRRPIPARVFGDWSMKLATRDTDASIWRHDIVYPKLETLKELRRHPESAVALLATLSRNVETPRQPGLLHNSAPSAPGGSLLEGLIHTAVIPELIARRTVIRDSRVEELADLLLASDSSAALDLIHEQLGDGNSPLPLYTRLLEPAARRLGDLWRQDVCSEFDLTIGLSHLQTAVRLLAADSLPPLPMQALPPAVLVVPLPGELHGLGAALDSEAMWYEGWSPQAEFPRDDAALRKILTGGWFDVLDVSLSVALRREHWLPRLAETIRLARRASRNPALVVTVGGRVFSEHAAGPQDVQANAAHGTASDVTTDILRMLASPERVR